MVAQGDDLTGPDLELDSTPSVGSPTACRDSFKLLGLIVQFITVPASVPVSIDIKPGGRRNSINSKSKGRIPVAILSSATFDAPSEVNVTSLTFGLYLAVRPVSTSAGQRRRT